MGTTAFAEMEFWLLVIMSMVAPMLLWRLLHSKRTPTRSTIFSLGLVLVVISGTAFYLLQTLAAQSKQSPSLADDALFASELTLSLYLLPALFAGIGINLISDRLIRHLRDSDDASGRDGENG